MYNTAYNILHSFFYSEITLPYLGKQEFILLLKTKRVARCCVFLVRVFTDICTVLILCVGVCICICFLLASGQEGDFKAYLYGVWYV